MNTQDKKSRMAIAAVVGAVVGVLTVLCFSCGTSGNNAPAEKEVFEFPRVEIPVHLADQQARAEFLAAHWWDNVDFTDSAYLRNREVTEQALADYLGLLFVVSPDKAEQSVNDLIDKSLRDARGAYFVFDRLEHYLWDPNSPLRNEEIYIPVLEKYLSLPFIDSLARIRYSFQLEMALKNRRNTPAADFALRTADGRSFSLYDIKSAFTLLFFSNPGCSACAEVTEQITGSPIVNIMEGREHKSMPLLTVVTVYPDADLDAWRKYLPGMPEHWINAYNPGEQLHKNRIYDLKAIPTLYLLDEDKNVLMKDANFVQIEAVFMQLARIDGEAFPLN